MSSITITAALPWAVPGPVDQCWWGAGPVSVGGTPAWATLTDTVGNTNCASLPLAVAVGREGGRQGGTTYNMPPEPVRHTTNINIFTHTIYSTILILVIKLILIKLIKFN